MHGYGVGMGTPGLGVDNRLALPADHQLRQLHNGGILHGSGGNQLAVPKDGDVIGSGHNLIQTMGDENDCDAAGGNLLHNGNQLVCLRLRQNGGGLIEYQQLHAGFINFPGDFHELHIAYRQSPHQRILVQAHAYAVQRLPGVLAHGIKVQSLQILTQDSADGIGLGNFPVELNVLCNRKAGQEHEFLMHHANTHGHGVLRRKNIDLLPIQKDFSLKSTGAVNHRHTEQGIHQGGFACTVLAEKRVDLAGLYGKRHIAQNRVIAVLLADVLHFQYEFVLHSLCSSLYTVRRVRPNKSGGPVIWTCILLLLRRLRPWGAFPQ